MNEAVMRRLRELLAFYSGVSDDKLSPASSRDNTPGWDSVANLSLMAAVEEEFNVTILTGDALELKSLADLARFVEARTAAKASG
jgi:acyl carrier protein